jgi:hypothetical protein
MTLVYNGILASRLDDAQVRARFDQSLTRWHAILAALPHEGTVRVTAFMTLADEVAGYVANGLDRTEATDELLQLACARGLNDADAVQWIISRAFDHDGAAT